MSVFLLLWIFLSLLSRCASDDEVEVSCDFMASCVLPCSFQTGLYPVVNWQRPGAPFISRYHHGKDHGARHSDYINRTSVFVSEIPRGNASMMLREVRVQDEGLYYCWASTSDRMKKTSIRLRVRVPPAPVVGVSLEQRGEELLCRSEGIYPKPDVTWSFSAEPPQKPHTTFTSSSQSGLFSVFSSVSLTLSSPHEYICNISTEHSWRSATYRRTADVGFSDSVTVPCTEPTAPVNSLVWKFNHEEVIYNRTGSELVYTESWRPFMDGLTESNHLVLKDLTWDKQGLFSCELSTETETCFSVTEVTKKKPKRVRWWVLAAPGLFVTVIVALSLRYKSDSLKRKWKEMGELKVREERAALEQATSNEPELLAAECHFPGEKSRREIQARNPGEKSGPTHLGLTSDCNHI